MGTAEQAYIGLDEPANEGVREVHVESDLFDVPETLEFLEDLFIGFAFLDLGEFLLQHVLYELIDGRVAGCVSATLESVEEVFLEFDGGT